ARLWVTAPARPRRTRPGMGAVCSAAPPTPPRRVAGLAEHLRLMPEVLRHVRSEILAQQGERSDRDHADDREDIHYRAGIRTDDNALRLGAGKIGVGPSLDVVSMSEWGHDLILVE